MEFIPLLLLAPLLVATGYSDLRSMRIPNLLPLGAAGLFFLVAWFCMPPESIFYRTCIASGFLALGFAAFAARAIGGGDVKMLAALVLFVPPATFTLFMLLFSGSLLLGIALVSGLRRAPARFRSGWKGLQAGSGFPMGVSIAIAGLLHPLVIAGLFGWSAIV